VGKASSANKIATTAEKARAQRVRPSRGRVFPVALGAAIVLGLLLVGWSRNSARAVANVAPKASAGTTLGDHWHVAFGVYNCAVTTSETVTDKWLKPIAKINEPLDATTGLPDDAYKVTGIHSHNDGVLHVHPFGSKGAGKNATLGTYFKMVGVKVTDSKLEMPEGLGTMTNGDKCDGKDAKLKLLIWDKADSTDDPAKNVTEFSKARFKNDGMAMALVFVPEDFDVKTLKPPSAANLAELGAKDGGTKPPTSIAVDTATTLAGAATSVAGATTVAPTSSSSAG
jgi:hypothetical protein